MRVIKITAVPGTFNGSMGHYEIRIAADASEANRINGHVTRGDPDFDIAPVHQRKKHHVDGEVLEELRVAIDFLEEKGLPEAARRLRELAGLEVPVGWSDVWARGWIDEVNAALADVVAGQDSTLTTRRPR